MVRIPVLALALLACPLGVMAQDMSRHDSRDPYECKVCKPALERAVGYVNKHYRGDGLEGHVFGGLMYLIMGDRGSGLGTCLNFCRGSVNGRGGNRNWWMAMCMYFLSEAYVRYPMGSTASAMTGALKTAVNEQEETGGWCHSKGMWKNGYNKRGGGKDIAILTAMMYAAFLNMELKGLQVPKPLKDRTEKNLESLSDGFGFQYGTDNKSFDSGMGRGGYVLLGLANARKTEHPFYDKIIQGMNKRYKQVERGHSFAPLHFYSVAASMHRVGMYQLFADEWIDKLIERQEPSGTVKLEHDGGKRGDKFGNKTANAACLAIILLLQQEDAFKPPEEKKKEEKKPGGPSPFGKGKEAKPDPIQTGKKEEKPRSKKSPFGRD